MNKTEFEERFGGPVSQDEFSLIERVYNYHPSIPNVEGKDVIANLYKLGGLRLMHDMLPAADAAVAIESSILRINAVLSQLNGISRSLANGSLSPGYAIDMSRHLDGQIAPLSTTEQPLSDAEREVA